MIVGSRGPALQESSGKRREWISLQLQSLKLTDTTTKLRVSVCFQRRVQIVFHMFGSINGLHCSNKLRNGDLDEFPIVLLTQFSTTKSRSNFTDPRFQIQVQSEAIAQLSQKQDFHHQPNHHYRPPTLHEPVSVASHDPLQVQRQVKQRNRQRLLLNMVDTSTGETPFTGLDAGRIQTHGSNCSDTKPACRRARLSL